VIDLHCHLLPGIDDGPETLEEALDLARLAVANGIRRAVVTPHIQPGCWDNDRRSIERVWGTFLEAVARYGLPLELGMAAEVRLCAEMIGLLAEDRIPFLGEYRGKRVLLLEFPHDQIPVGTEKFVRWLLRQDIQPMIAHPERNKAVIRDFSRIFPYVDMDCLFQVTSGSLVGRFGPFAEERALQFLEEGWITVLASDAHNARHRPPELRDGRDLVARLAGVEMARRLVEETPAAIVGLLPLPSPAEAA
jgi:protein-tyrosine phosphatase